MSDIFKIINNTDSGIKFPIDETITSNDERYIQLLKGSSTAISPIKYFMDKELANIFLQAADDELYEEDPSIIIKLREWIENYGKEAIEHLAYYLENRIESLYLKSVILEMFGDIKNLESLEERIKILEYYLQDHSSPQLQYGAVMGLANLKSRRSLSLLKTIDISIQKPLLKNAIESTISYLNR